MKKKHRATKRRPVTRSLKKQKRTARGIPRTRAQAARSASLRIEKRRRSWPSFVVEEASPLPPSAANDLVVEESAESEAPLPVDSGRDIPRLTHKSLRLLLVTPLSEPAHPAEGQSIPDALRLLVKELLVVKAYEGFTDTLHKLRPDILLMISGAEPIHANDLEMIRHSEIPSAIWLNDENGITDSLRQTALAFNYVFSQHHSHLASYKQAGCMHADYLPFPANPEVFAPKQSTESKRCDLLVIGNAGKLQEEYIRLIERFSQDLIVHALGKGWEPYSAFILAVSSKEPLRDVYNRANMIIHWEPVQRRVFEAAACGVFQLVEANPDLFKYMEASQDVIPFQDAAELDYCLTYYSEEVDRRRIIASRALWRTRYDYSPLHMAMELLQRIVPLQRG